MPVGRDRSCNAGEHHVTTDVVTTDPRQKNDHVTEDYVKPDCARAAHVLMPGNRQNGQRKLTVVNIRQFCFALFFDQLLQYTGTPLCAGEHKKLSPFTTMCCGHVLQAFCV